MYEKYICGGISKKEWDIVMNNYAYFFEIL